MKSYKPSSPRYKPRLMNNGTTFQAASITIRKLFQSITIQEHLTETYTPTNPTDPEPLTPDHQLHGRRVTTLPYQASIPDADVVAYAIKSDYSTSTKRAHQQKKIIDHFRDRWKLEYLTALREYHSTTAPQGRIDRRSNREMLFISMTCDQGQPGS